MINTEKFEKEYIRLNEAQKNAVDNIYGPLMVVAGPGTGKTQILSLRAANIILKTGIDPRNILITTFTEAGIISIKNRLFDIIGSDSYKIKVSTIHSFCNDVILAFPEKFLQYRAIKPIDDVEKIEIFEQILDNSDYKMIKSDYDRYFYIRAIIDKINKLKQEGISPGEFKIIIEKQRKDYEEELCSIDPKLKKYENTRLSQEKHISKLLELNDAYGQYLSILNEKGLYDFVDMIDFVLKAFKEDENLRYYYALEYQFIMVDEYQDTNNAQNEIVDLILSAGEDKNIMTVGDDDQSIYRFQGANLENMLNFSKKYENTKFVVLTENYRSTQNILDLASKSISNNSSRISNYIPGIVKNLKSNLSEDIEPIYLGIKNDIEEKAIILETVKGFRKEGIPDDEIAIITRTNKEVEEWTDFFHLSGINVESKVKSNILKSRHINLILDLVYICFDPFDDEKLINVLRSQFSEVENIDVLVLLKKLNNFNYTKKDKIKLFDLISNPEYLESIIKEESIQKPLFTTDDDSDFNKLSDIDNLRLFVGNILYCQNELNSNFYNFFKCIIENFKVVEIMEKVGDFGDVEDLFTLLNIIKNWVEKDRNIDSKSFFKKIGYYYKYNLIIPRNIINENNSGIQVLTAHQSKGLEYGIVFIPGLYHGNWGGRRVNDLIKLPFGVVGSSISETLADEDGLQEERRLFFVAITRAKRKLFLSMPAGIDNKPKLQSEFLQELELPIKQVGEIDTDDILRNQFKSKNNTQLLNSKEEFFIKDFLRNYKLSPSDLNKIIEDPRLFLRDTVFKYPFKDNEFTIFGKVYHKTLEYFYLEYKKNLVSPEKDYLERTFVWLLSKEILSPEEHDRLKQKGIDGLNGWYDNKGALDLPLELEYNFRSRNIVFENIPLTGKIDKIDLMNDREVMLTDYKTGKPKTSNEIKGLTQNGDGKYFRQLIFYKIMFDLDKDLSKKYEVGSLAIEFVEGRDQKYPFIILDFNSLDIERVKQEIIEAWQKINDIGFWKDILK
ncbi:MAG: ATP-dependent DNA helicase [Candidatus Gracilibacteria bacterium]|nr:ATP-dependent DNA helicase [Candidatus Gracilibacteria bacterium]